MSDLLHNLPLLSEFRILMMIITGLWVVYDAFFAKNSWLYPNDEGNDDGIA